MLLDLCRSVHPTLIAGKCPWCGGKIRKGKAISGPIRWIEEVSHSDPDRRINAIDRLPTSGPAAEDAVAVARRTIDDPHKRVRYEALLWLRRFAAELTPEDVAKWQEALDRSPHDRSLRVILFCYHDSPLARQKCPDPKARYEQMLWLVWNWPDVPTIIGYHLRPDPAEDQHSYDRAACLWLQHVDASPSNLAILDNATMFFWHFEPDIAERLAKSGQNLDPENSWWPTVLAGIYLDKMAKAKGDERRLFAAELVRHLEAERRLWGGKHFHELFELGWAAVESGDIPKAQACADELLGQTTDKMRLVRMRAVQQENLLLGEIALAQGNVASALVYLGEAGRAYSKEGFQGGCHRIALATKLLERGETEAVIQFIMDSASPMRLSPAEVEDCLQVVKDGGSLHFDPFNSTYPLYCGPDPFKS